MAIGCVLGQKNQDNLNVVVAFYSKMLKNEQLNYATTEKECLALISGIKHFRIYLEFQKFYCFTDHKALKWLMTIKTENDRLIRWSLYLQGLDFELIYQKGINLCNADGLSRPVFDIDENIVDKLNKITEIDSNRKDIFKNDALMQFVIDNTHKENISKKERKLVEKESKNYKFLGKTMWYKHKEDVWAIVPHPDERQEIVERVHLLGHFSTAITRERLSHEFWWRHLNRDIDDVIASCGPCQRNKLVPANFNPAKAMQVSRLNEVVQFDCIWGLPKDSEGYCGILVTIERMSGYCKIKPLRTKRQEEIALGVWEWMCIHGPPQTLLSDQGAEFVNKVLDTISKTSGVEHKVTAPYHPQTNGMCERLNQTVVSVLRKHAEENQSGWKAWLAYTEWNLNTKICSNRKFVPYKLMFGRHPPDFAFDCNKSLERPEEMEIRQKEIKHLIENIHKTLDTNQDVSQEKQKKLQDNRNRIAKENLQINSWVLIKKMNIISKLESRYIGPYKVLGQDKFDNYILQYATGGKLNTPIPLEHLKPIPTPKDKSYEIKRIIKEREVKGKKEYLVEWKELEDQTWVPVDKFDSMTLVNRFIKQSRADVPTGPPKRKVGRPRKTTIPPQIIITIIMLLLIPLGITEQIVGKFSVCLYDSNSKPVDTTKVCSRPQSIENKELKDRLTQYWAKTSNNSDHLSHQMFIYAKYRFHIRAPAILCRITKHVANFDESFFTFKYKWSYDQEVKVSRKECLKMANDQLCRNKQMICENKSCVYKPDMKPVFKWWTRKTQEFFECETHEKLVLAQTEDELLPSSNCKIKEKWCLMRDHTLIWTIKDTNKCEYRYEMQTLLNKKGLKLMSEKDSLLFYATELVQINPDCLDKNNIHEIYPLIKTAEGAFLSFTKFGEKMKEPSGDLHELALADNDFYSYQRILEYDSVHSVMCKMFQHQLDNFKEQQNKYKKFSDYNNKEIILLAYQNAIYIPKCTIIHRFSIQSTTKCFVDIPIFFQVNNEKQKRNGFINSDGIIHLNSKEITCTKGTKYTKLNNGDTLIKQGNVITRVSTTDVGFQSFVFADTSQNNKFHHSDLLTTYFDFYLEMSLQNSNKYVVSTLTETYSPGEEFPVVNITNLKRYVLGFCSVLSLICFIKIIIVVKRKSKKKEKDTELPPNQNNIKKQTTELESLEHISTEQHNINDRTTKQLLETVEKNS